jgi:dienelactone hydrolase
MKLNRFALPFLIGWILLMAGCAGSGQIFVPVSYTPKPPDNLPVTEVMPTPGPVAIPEAPGLPAVEYDLGDFDIPQPGNPEGDMPARLRGLIALPVEPGPRPVAVVLHGAGFGCPPQDDTQTTWPCGAVEQPNWTGFSYLASALAARGYIALVPDANAQYEIAYGEARGFHRLAALASAHLARLAEASAGRELGFGADLTGRVDLERIVLLGHGLGADGALAIASPQAQAPTAVPSDDMPVSAVLLIAPHGPPRASPVEAETVSAYRPTPMPGSLPDVAMAVVLPECDGNDPELDGARYYEAARIDRGRTTLAAEVVLRGANENAFNSFFLADDGDVLAGVRSGCEQESRLGLEAQRGFLAQYAGDFFDAVLGGPEVGAAAAAGLDPAMPEPAFLYWQAALTSLAVPSEKRLRLIVPDSVSEVGNNLADGRAQIAPPAEVTFCPGDPSEETLCAAGFHPAGGLPFPATLRLAWDGAGGLYQLDLPEEFADLSSYAALSLRATVDPADSRNAPAAAAGGSVVSFSMVLRDAAGGAAVVRLPEGIPALAFPPGELRTGETPLWSGLTPLSSIRIPLGAFQGVDLSQVAGLAFSFDGPEKGAIRIADLEFVAR